MNLNKAVNRFQYRFSKDDKGEFRNFKPNSQDVEAINCILTWINNQKKTMVSLFYSTIRMNSYDSITCILKRVWIHGMVDIFVG